MSASFLSHGDLFDDLGADIMRQFSFQAIIFIIQQI